jgi:hypothetical protein
MELDKRERLAVASLTGVAQAYGQSHRLAWQEAMDEVQRTLARWKIRPERIAEVLAQAAAGYLAPDYPWPDVLQLLVDCGVDLDRTAQIADEHRRRPGIRLGDAQLGGHFGDAG